MVARTIRLGLVVALPVVVGAIVVMQQARPARAQPRDAIAQARKHYAAGRALYDLGNYEDALREFTTGYELLPRPLFLLDIGQCQRKLREFDKARTSFAEFLERAPKEDAARPRAMELLQLVEREAKAAQQANVTNSSAVAPSGPAELKSPEVKPEAPPPVATPPAAPPSLSVAPAPAAGAPATNPGAALAPPLPATTARARKRRRLAIGLSLGGVALLAGAGLAVGLTLVLRPDRFPSSTLGTVGFGR
jgi:tetratricopeptide (TPR) repeat protein